MKKQALTIALGSLALAGCATPGVSHRERAEARLATMLQGRVAGAPRSCITAYDGRHLQILEQTAVVYETGPVIWVSRPADPKMLDTSDIIVVKRTGSRLCKQDIIRTVDRTSGFTTGVVFLGDFVPYRRP